MAKKYKKYNPRVMSNIAKIKDFNKISYFIFVGMLLFLLITLFTNAFNISAQFRTLNSMEEAALTGAKYNEIAYVENITYGNFIFGIPTAKTKVAYFETTLLIVFILEVVALALILVPLKGKYRNLNKYKNISAGIILIASSIVGASHISSLQPAFEDILVGTINMMEYLAESPYSAKPGAMVSVSTAILIFGGLLSIVNGATWFYLDKNEG